MSACIVKTKKVVDYDASIITILGITAALIGIMRNAAVIANFNYIQFAINYAMNYHFKAVVYRMVDRKAVARSIYRLLLPKAEIVLSKHREIKKIAR